MKINVRHMRGLILAKVTLGLFLALTFIAMLTYPGGTGQDPQAQGYQFFQNFFSDLGRLSGFTGESKFTSMGIFVTSLLMASIGQVIFFYVFPKFFKGVGKKSAVIGSFFGIFTGLGYIGIALTPWDLFGALHLQFVHITFLSFLISVIAYISAIFRNPEYPNKFAWIFVVYCFILSAYLGILFFGPSLKTQWGLTIHATSQKIMVYSQVICVSLQIWGAIKIGERRINESNV